MGRCDPHLNLDERRKLAKWLERTICNARHRLGRSDIRTSWPQYEAVLVPRGQSKERARYLPSRRKKRGPRYARSSAKPM
jgi:hypothetical protein